MITPRPRHKHNHTAEDDSTQAAVRYSRRLEKEPADIYLATAVE